MHYKASSQSYAYRYDYDRKLSNTVVGVRGAIHLNELLESSQFDVYGGVMLGYNIGSYKDKTTRAYNGITEDYSDNYHYKLNFVTWSTFVGGRYLFSDHFGAYLELGYGLSYLNLGLTAKFRSTNHSWGPVQSFALWRCSVRELKERRKAIFFLSPPRTIGNPPIRGEHLANCPAAGLSSAESRGMLHCSPRTGDGKLPSSTTPHVRKFRSGIGWPRMLPTKTERTKVESKRFKYTFTQATSPYCQFVTFRTYPVPLHPSGMSKKVYIESYGCQMNVSDSEVVASILAEQGYTPAASAEEADLVLLNTCSVREKAEYTVLQRINEMNRLKTANKSLKVGVLGCMAERMKEQLLVEKKVVDLVVGPDAYRSLPKLLDDVGSGQKAVNVLLSREETYGEIVPVRLNSNGVTAFVTIMRGCDNMCAFCVVPFTRGRERSRDPESIEAECLQLVREGYKEVTLLGQNVDSYRWNIDVRGAVKDPTVPVTDFADLLERVAINCPGLRIRYSTSHPKDMTDKVLAVMARYDNICKYIHLPVQSGSSVVLKNMNRGYDREWYLGRIASIRRHMPDCAISTDIIAGFCGETEEDHEATLEMIREVGYDMAFMFKYSERPKTLAARKLPDDVPEEVKSRRLAEVIETQKASSAKRMAGYVGQMHQVLIEGVSKRSAEFMFGRNTQNAVVIVPRYGSREFRPGDLINVRITSATAGSLQGEPVSLVNEPALQA